MKALTLILAHASADQVNCVVSHRDLRTPLHLACSAINLPVAQLLLWVSDKFKMTRIHIACRDMITQTYKIYYALVRIPRHYIFNNGTFYEG